MAKYFVLFVLIITLLDVAFGLYISRTSLIINLDETFMVICRDEGGQYVTWQGPNGTLNAKTRPMVQHGSYGTSILFNKTKIEDAGNYTCILNASPQVRKVFSLTVREDLEFQRTPKNHIVREDRGFIIPCHTNLKDVDITWELESGEALDEKKYRVLPEGLHIINVTRNDAQVYKCRAHHLASGAIIYKNITLDVHHKPYQTYAEEEVYVFLDEQVNLTCEVETNPPPIFKWYRKMGKTIQVSDYISVLQLNVTKETPGAYMCIAYNTVGDLEKYFNVQLAEHPDMPTNIELVKAENDKLQLKVEVPDIPYRARDPVMDPQWIVLEYKPESESEWSSMEFNITDSIILIGLSKNTKYRIQAATRNAAGLSQYYQTMFETSAGISVHTKLSAVIYSPFILISFFSLFWIA